MSKKTSAWPLECKYHSTWGVECFHFIREQPETTSNQILLKVEAFRFTFSLQSRDWMCYRAFKPFEHMFSIYYRTTRVYQEQMFAFNGLFDALVKHQTGGWRFSIPNQKTVIHPLCEACRETCTENWRFLECYDRQSNYGPGSSILPNRYCDKWNPYSEIPVQISLFDYLILE